jgi:uncharacterized membrane protein YdfJ with MMPL/SSD domain
MVPRVIRLLAGISRWAMPLTGTTVEKLRADRQHVENVQDFWGEPLTAARSQSGGVSSTIFSTAFTESLRCSTRSSSAHPDDHEQIAHAYGDNAIRLLAAKRHYDPDGLFNATPLPVV